MDKPTREDGEAAIAWLKEHVQQHGPIQITWEVAPEEDPIVMDGVLDILFRPRTGPNAA